MFAGLLQHSTRNNVLCTVATAPEYHFVCTAQTNGAVLVNFLNMLMCLNPYEHYRDSIVITIIKGIEMRN